MSSRIRVRGDQGVLRWGYKRAADIGAWTYADGVLVAELRNVHPFAVTQTPLVFVVPHTGAGRLDLGPLAAHFNYKPPTEFRRELIGVVVQPHATAGAARLTAQFAPKVKG